MFLYQVMKGNQGSHPHLLIKQLKEELRRSGINLSKMLLQMNVDYYQLGKTSMREVLHQVVAKVKSSVAYQEYQEEAHHRIKEQVDSLYSSDSRKHTYLVDCFKEATAFPIVKEREVPSFNFAPLYKQNISKELRRVVWSRQFNHESNRKKFTLVDREVTPYNVTEELKLSLDKLSGQEGITLKQNQKDNALRIIQYFVKVSGKIPHRYHNYIAIIVVDLFSFFTLSKITELGAVVLGLVSLADSYRQIDVQVRFSKIMRAIEIVDNDSAQYIKKYHSQGNRQLNENYQYFRLTLGASHLSVDISQFLIDQLIIRKFCQFDMYILFAIMILIISDDFEPEKKEKPSLKEVLARAKSIIKLQDFVDAYRTIYDQIPAIHSVDDMQHLSNNELFIEMLSSNAKKSNLEEEKDFVITEDTPVRISYQR